MFKRLSELDQPALINRFSSDAPLVLQALHRLIEEVFGENHSTEEMREIFEFPYLELDDPNGLVSQVFATSSIKEGSGMSLEVYTALIRDQITPQQPIIIIGHVGVGKSTLVHYTFANLLGSEAFPIFIDFKGVRTDTNAIPPFVVETIDEELTKTLHSNDDPTILEKVFFHLYPARRLYFENLSKIDAHEAFVSKHKALERLGDDLEKWNKARIRYIQEKLGRKIYLIFDNVDHHVSTDFIQKTIAEGMGQAFSNECRLIITLRRGNFGLAYEEDPFAAKSFTLVRLEGPDIRRLVDLRVRRILKKYEDRKFSEKIRSGSYGMSPTIYLRVLTERLGALLNPSVREFLEGFSGKNRRRLLMCVRHVFSVKTLSHPEELTRSVLSKYDVLECLLRPSGPAYLSGEMDPQAMAINLFEDGTPKEPGNNLIRIRVLQCLDHYGNRALYEDVARNLCLLGYTKDRVRRVLDLFRAQGLVEAGDHSQIMSSTDGQDFCHQLTSIGRFYLGSLIYEYRYVLAIKEDTSFPNDYYDRIVGSGIASGRLEQREAEIVAFHDYIDKMELEEERYCTDRTSLRIFPRIAEKLKKEHRLAIHALRGAARDRGHHEREGY
jgi:hypothetical protein